MKTLQNTRKVARLFILVASIALLTFGCDEDSNDQTSDMVSDGTTSEDMTSNDTTTPDTTTPDPDTSEGPELLGADNPPELGTQVDRSGRAAISSALVDTFNGDSSSQGATKDAYNSAGPDEWADFAPTIAGSLAIVDALDANCGNQLLADNEMGADAYATLASILADDQLYVHSDRGTCGTYLGLEAEIVGALGEGDGGCGGRTLDDDIIDRSYSVLAAGILTGVDDTITENDKPNSSTFPFLAAP